MTLNEFKKLRRSSVLIDQEKRVFVLVERSKFNRPKCFITYLLRHNDIQKVFTMKVTYEDGECRGRNAVITGTSFLTLIGYMVDIPPIITEELQLKIKALEVQ